MRKHPRLFAFISRHPVLFALLIVVGLVVVSFPLAMLPPTAGNVPLLFLAALYPIWWWRDVGAHLPPRVRRLSAGLVLGILFVLGATAFRMISPRALGRLLASQRLLVTAEIACTAFLVLAVLLLAYVWSRNPGPEAKRERWSGAAAASSPDPAAGDQLAPVRGERTDRAQRRQILLVAILFLACVCPLVVPRAEWLLPIVFGVTFAGSFVALTIHAWRDAAGMPPQDRRARRRLVVGVLIVLVSLAIVEVVILSLPALVGWTLGGFLLLVCLAIAWLSARRPIGTPSGTEIGPF
ncbi:MAG TPA: hypothetical protein VHQ90_25230 [Thermoanaerobaculia bacterium]|nr:hypothetical protein [Thermoanaerobaculia bacterium]